MGRRKKMDKLSQDMIQCKKDGFGCSYGKWKAMQEPVKVEKKIPDGWKECPVCGKPFKSGKGKKFCDEVCRMTAYNKSEKQKEYMKKYKERKRAENG